MDCPKAKQMMSEAIDGQLQAHEQAQLNAHLAGCPACQEEYAQMQAIQRGLQELPEEKLPKRVQRAYRAEMKKDREPIDWKRYASIAAVLCLMITGIYFMQDTWKKREEKIQNVSDSQAGGAVASAEREKQGLVDMEAVKRLEEDLYGQGSGLTADQSATGTLEEDGAGGIWYEFFDIMNKVITEKGYSALPSDAEFQICQRWDVAQAAYETGNLYEVTTVPLEKVAIHAEKVGIEWYNQAPILMVEEDNLQKMQLLFYKLDLSMTLEPGMVIYFYQTEE